MRWLSATDEGVRTSKTLDDEIPNEGVSRAWLAALLCMIHTERPINQRRPKLQIQSSVKNKIEVSIISPTAEDWNEKEKPKNNPGSEDAVAFIWSGLGLPTTGVYNLGYLSSSSRQWSIYTHGYLWEKVKARPFIMIVTMFHGYIRRCGTHSGTLWHTSKAKPSITPTYGTGTMHILRDIVHEQPYSVPHAIWKTVSPVELESRLNLTKIIPKQQPGSSWLAVMWHEPKCSVSALCISLAYNLAHTAGTLASSLEWSGVGLLVWPETSVPNAQHLLRVGSLTCVLSYCMDLVLWIVTTIPAIIVIMRWRVWMYDHPHNGIEQRHVWSNPASRKIAGSSCQPFVFSCIGRDTIILHGYETTEYF